MLLIFIYTLTHAWPTLSLRNIYLNNNFYGHFFFMKFDYDESNQLEIIVNSGFLFLKIENTSNENNGVLICLTLWSLVDTIVSMIVRLTLSQ